MQLFWEPVCKHNMGTLGSLWMTMLQKMMGAISTKWYVPFLSLPIFSPPLALSLTHKHYLRFFLFFPSSIPFLYSPPLFLPSSPSKLGWITCLNMTPSPLYPYHPLIPPPLLLHFFSYKNLGNLSFPSLYSPSSILL